MKIRGHLIFVISVFILALVGGSAFYHFVEGWRFLDSIYFSVMTVTTVGYGDFIPRTDVGKIFTMFYAFFGVAMALYILTKISSVLFKKHVSEKVSEIKRDIKKEEAVEKKIEKVIRKNLRGKKR